MPAFADPDGSAMSTTFGGDEYLFAGADAIRAGQFDDGIRLTLIGLARVVSTRNRAAGLANLCAAYVSKREPDAALPFCAEALRLAPGNWRAYTARSQAYFQKGLLAEAARDNEAAAAINPNAAHVKMMLGKINERRLQPQIVVEDHH
jgi:tetratricopeptide (TPR) repeat protein